MWSAAKQGGSSNSSWWVRKPVIPSKINWSVKSWRKVVEQSSHTHGPEISTVWAWIWILLCSFWKHLTLGGTCCSTAATATENTTENSTPFAASFLEHRVCYHSLEKQGGKLVWEKNQFAIRLEINCKHVEEFYFFFHYCSAFSSQSVVVSDLFW